jgi:hypothetical protein
VALVLSHRILRTFSRSVIFCLSGLAGKDEQGASCSPPPAAAAADARAPAADEVAVGEGGQGATCVENSLYA